MSVFVEAAYGARERRPFVTLRIDGVGETQLRPAEALDVANHLREAASAALSDAGVVEMIGGEKLTTEEVAATLVHLREARVAVDQREGTTT